MYVFAYVYIHTYIYVYTFLFIRLCVCACMHIYACMYIMLTKKYTYKDCCFTFTTKNTHLQTGYDRRRRSSP